MTIKKLLIISLAIALAFNLAACSSRKSEQKQKGARENVVLSENPRTEENSLIVSKPEPESSEESSEPEKDPIPEEMAGSFLSAIKSGRRDNIQAFADYNTLFNLTEGQNSDWLLQQVLMRMGHEIISSDVTEDKAVVTAKVSNLDMNVVLPLYFEQAMEASFKNASEQLGKNQEEMDAEYRKIFTDLLAQYESTRIDRLMEINLEKKDGKWQIISTPELGNRVLGGFLEAQDRVRGDMASSAAASSEEAPASSSSEDSGEYSEIVIDEDPAA